MQLSSTPPPPHFYIFFYLIDLYIIHCFHVSKLTIFIVIVIVIVTAIVIVIVSDLASLNSKSECHSNPRSYYVLFDRHNRLSVLSSSAKPSRTQRNSSTIQYLLCSNLGRFLSLNNNSLSQAYNVNHSLSHE